METIKIKGITFINGDCMEFLKEQEENSFDLAIVDPPYGIGEDGRKSKGRTQRKDGTIRHGIDKRNGAKIVRKETKYKAAEWDNNPPNKEYFKLLKTYSKNQIIWGANHFIENINANSSAWVVWDKVNGNSDFADCELAWTSFNTAVRMFTFMWNGMLQGSYKNGKISEGNKSKCESRIHPTQKPVQLYKWLLLNYAKEGQTILDTHGGSGSIAIACHQLGFELTIIEKDKEYFDAMVRRFKLETAQQTLF